MSKPAPPPPVAVSSGAGMASGVASGVSAWWRGASDGRRALVLIVAAIAVLLLGAGVAGAMGGSGHGAAAPVAPPASDPASTPSETEPASTPPAVPANAVVGVVNSVTVKLGDGSKVHLAQIDGPHEATDCYGSGARRELSRLLPVGTLVGVRAQPGLKPLDQNGRRVAYLFRGQTNVALEMVRRGAAAPYFLDNVKGRYASQLLSAAESAKANQRGLWKACSATRLYPYGLIDTKRPPPGTTVTEVIDGDTIVVASGQHVRLVQIDTPELASDECYATQATQATEGLLPIGTRVILKSDPSLDQTDRYGRALRYVYRGTENVNLALVRMGAAAPYFYQGDRGQYAGRLYHLAVAAKSAHRGLWGTCSATELAPTSALATHASAPPATTGSGGSGGSSGDSGGSSGGGGTSSCTPGYSPCLVYHGGEDYDCSGGSGNGPYYTAPGVTYTVSGSDPYGLDGDGDGYGCQ